jgi:undecaprenyl diphosphate synthase
MSKNSLEHLAIIMDGNGRWAKNRGKTRTAGHKKGAEVVRDITTYCSNHSTIKTLTLYAFSTENWKRPKLEVEFLMKLLDNWLKNELDSYNQNNIKFQAIGDITKFSPKLQERILETQKKTKNNIGLTQVLALNYGSRTEIVDAVNRSINQGKTVITEEDISDNLDTPYSDIDLLIRTSGEKRVSNYLLWQLSYSEFNFTNTYWPDFTIKELEIIIEDFKNRNRRFGGV